MSNKRRLRSTVCKALIFFASVTMVFMTLMLLKYQIEKNYEIMIYQDGDYYTFYDIDDEYRLADTMTFELIDKNQNKVTVQLINREPFANTLQNIVYKNSIIIDCNTTSELYIYQRKESLFEMIFGE